VSGNWTGSAVPASGDIAEFNTTFSNQPTIGSTATSAGAVWGATGLGQNVLISGTATLTLNDATVHSLATTDILLDDTGNHSLEIDASVAIANQSSITVNNTATLTLGASAGSANLAIAATDTLTFTGSGGVILVNDNVTSTSGAITVNTTGAAVKLTGSNSNNRRDIGRSGLVNHRR
jgi:hypothetical protein